MEDKEFKKKVGLFDDKIAIVKKYGVVGFAIITFPFWQPYLDEYMDKHTEKVVRKAVTEASVPISEKLVMLSGSVTNMESIMINCKGGSKALLSKDIDYIARKAVGMQSIIKVKQMKVVLLKYPRNTEIQKKRLRVRIKNILIKNSKVYVKDLNNYQHRAIGRIGDYVWNEFPMGEFLSVIY